MSSTGIVFSERSNESEKFTFMRVPGSARKRGTVSRLGNIRCSRGIVSMDITHPHAREPSRNNNHNNCGGSEECWCPSGDEEFYLLLLCVGCFHFVVRHRVPFARGSGGRFAFGFYWFYLFYIRCQGFLILRFPF